MGENIFRLVLTLCICWGYAQWVMTPISDWLPLLRRIFLFSSFTGDQLSFLAKKMTLVSYPKGAVLFHESDPGDSLFLILSGTVRILKNHTNLSELDDKQATLAYLNRGDALGEMSLLIGEQRSHTAVVESTADILVLQKKDFDQLLQKKPEMAVHLSRILSNRLASVHRSGGLMPQPAKIFSIVSALDPRDQAVFVVNLALSLTEQTHRKTLLCVFDEGHGLIPKSLGLHSTTVSELQARAGAMHNIKTFNDYVMVHPSGLDVIVIDFKMPSPTFGTAMYPFISLLKDTYDTCLMAFPSEFRENGAKILNESDRVLVVTSTDSPPHELEAIHTYEQAMTSGKKPQKILLTAKYDGHGIERPFDLRIDWSPDWSRRLENLGTAFFPPSATNVQRALDRLARDLGGLRIGFAMGSGAAFGYALIGMLRVLERENIFPDVISGTSMGALIGAFYSMGKDPDELERIACSISRKKLWQMADPILPRTGLIRGNGILNFLKSHLGDRDFKDLMLPFSCVATDIQTGKEIVMDQGNVAEAVRASLSLPFFFQPFYRDGRYLVDGGLVNPVPTSIVVEKGANILISANLTSKASERRVPGMIGWWRRHMPSVMRGPSIPEIMMKTIYIMQHEIAQTRSELAHVIMQIKSHSLLWWDLDQAKEMIRLGEASAEDVLPKIKSLLPYFANSCKVPLRVRGRKTY